jgi:isopenicillin N synthase-like dioxygenase
MRILELFAQGLEIDEESGGRKWFEERHDREKGGSGSVFRFLYYPSLPASQDAGLDTTNEDDGDMRCGAHSDYGSITLLFRRDGEGQAGLEILTEERTWASVPIHPESSPSASFAKSSNGAADEGPPILVNVGDLLSFWTNGLLKSTIHRVIFPTGNTAISNADRYSIAYFCHPLDQAKLEAMPSRLVDERKLSNGEQSVMTAKQHLESRLAATYT